MYTRETRRANSRAELHKRVATWSFHAALDWTSEETDDETAFMGRRDYYFVARSQGQAGLP